ncbi:MAG TPA: hypothetical protein VGX94_09560 [Terriglobia bacterium]|nr:hypothetical protein [Terriglobia bacterium]
MSAAKWELVTWDWIEREIVDYLLIANHETEKPHGKSLPSLLARRPAAGKPNQQHNGTKRRSSSNG